MLTLLPLLLLLQGATPRQPPSAANSDSARAARAAARAADSVKIAGRREARRIPMTPALEASAFKDSIARSIIALARKGRAPDSLLKSYEATRVSRVSVGVQVRGFGPEKLAYRQENATRIRWQRGVGVYLDVIGSRMAAPAVDDKVVAERGADLLSTADIPYYPGRESLWPLGEITFDEGPAEPWWMHPLAAGAEAYYRYEGGDSTTIVLSDGALVRTVEIRIEPREPRWDLVVGSFWFDRQSGQLVRAAYRPSIPADLGSIISLEGDEFPSWLQAPVFTISSVLLEFSLQEGRYWLPTLQVFNSDVRALMLRVPMKVEQRFEYLDVNHGDPLAPIPQPVRRAPNDTVVRPPLDSATRRQQTDSVRRTRQESCRTLGYSQQIRRSDSLAMIVRIPCDSAVLLHSPALPSSIFSDDERLFTATDRDFMQKALTLAVQPGWAPQRPTLEWGPTLWRYNRVEGFSPAIKVGELFGRGYTATASARYGFADRTPRGELTLSRSDGVRSISLTGYRRLVAANDWGSPLGFGASVSTVLFGRDEGFYYTGTGIEFVAQGTDNALFSWRLFAERERAASVHTNFSLPNALHDARFIDNIAATDADIVGMAARFSKSFGENPRGFRTFTDLRVEGAGGDTRFARGMAEISTSRALIGPVAGSLTASGGGSLGTLLPQRLWYLGGLYTVRGQAPRTREGDAFWMARAELGYGAAGARRVIFYDAGWAGDRAVWRTPGRPISGAGAGVSFLDGIIRFDVARGIQPKKGWRVDLYLESRF